MALRQPRMLPARRRRHAHRGNLSPITVGESRRLGFVSISADVEVTAVMSVVVERPQSAEVVHISRTAFEPMDTCSMTLFVPL